MTQIEHKSVFGLELQSNSFQVREGSLEIAENIVVSQDDIYKKRRGEKSFVDPNPTIAKTLREYGQKLIGICANKVQVYNQDDSGEYTSTTNLDSDTGVTVAVSDSGVGYSRAVESNGNLYFTSDNGILKLESTTGDVFRAGTAKALDLEIFRVITQTYESYLKPDTQIGYKAVFFRKDANQNKIVGSPSQLAIITNSLTQTGKSYVVSLTTATVTATSHGLGSPVSLWLYIKNATGSKIPDGAYYCTTTDANTFTFTVPSGASTTQTLDWGQFKQAKLRFTTPSGLKTTEYAYQIYRTDASATVSIEPDESTLQLVDEANLIASDLPIDVSGVGFVTYYDTTLDLLRQGYLYTNPNTGEGRGAADANEVPPTAKDIELFKDHVFYANCQTFYRLPVNLLASDSTTMPNSAKFLTRAISFTFVDADVSTSAETITEAAHGFSSGTPIMFTSTGTLPGGLSANVVYFAISASSSTIKVATTYANALAGTAINITSAAGGGVHTLYITRVFQAYTAVGNKSVQATSVSVALNLVTVNYTAHGFASGDTIAVVEAVSSAEVQDTIAARGIYTITVTSANQFTFVVDGTPAAIASLTFFGVTNVLGFKMFYAGQSNVGGSTGLTTVSTAIDDTSRAIVKAVNMDTLKVNNGFYVSSPNSIPGMMIFESTGTTTTFYINAITAAIVETFLPNFPLTGLTTIGTRDDEQGVIYVAKYLRPEASPIYAKIPVGTKSNPIQRIKALRDSLIVLKKEGAYRVNGSTIDTFAATILDNTVSCVSTDSVVTLNNTVFCLTEQGVVAISETAAAIVSRQIEPLFTAILGKMDSTNGDDLVELNTHAVGYESERLYVIATMSPQSDETDVVYVYNQVTNAWSTWTNIFHHAFVKPLDNHLYMIDTDDAIFRERKNNNRLDFSAAQFATTVLTTPSTATATLSITGGTAVVGDVLVINDIINIITTVTVSGGTTTYTFAAPFSFIATDTGYIYKLITSIIKTSPIHGGKVSVWKQFSEFQGTYRNSAALSRLKMSFISDSQSGSTETEWTNSFSSGGWGNEPWGNFPWGLEQGIETNYASSQAQPIRIYIPLEVQRGTFIQCVLTHAVAAEPIMLQSIALTAREYSQRTTR